MASVPDTFGRSRVSYGREECVALPPAPGTEIDSGRKDDEDALCKIKFDSQRRQDPGLVAHRHFALRSNRKVAARLQAFMGNDPRLRQSGQWKGDTKMSKRGVEILRTAFFQSAFSAAHNDPELRTCYQRKPAQGKTHEVALSYLMRFLTRRLVAVLRSGKPYQFQYNLKMLAGTLDTSHSPVFID